MSNRSESKQLAFGNTRRGRCFFVFAATLLLVMRICHGQGFAREPARHPTANRQPQFAKKQLQRLISQADGQRRTLVRFQRQWLEAIREREAVEINLKQLQERYRVLREQTAPGSPLQRQQRERRLQNTATAIGKAREQLQQRDGRERQSQLAQSADQAFIEQISQANRVLSMLALVDEMISGEVPVSQPWLKRPDQSQDTYPGMDQLTTFLSPREIGQIEKLIREYSQSSVSSPQPIRFVEDVAQVGIQIDRRVVVPFNISEEVDVCILPWTVAELAGISLPPPGVTTGGKPSQDAPGARDGADSAREFNIGDREFTAFAVRVDELKICGVVLTNHEVFVVGPGEPLPGPTAGLRWLESHGLRLEPAERAIYRSAESRKSTVSGVR